MNVKATINVSSPTGRKLVRELEKHKRIVKIENPESINGIPEDAIPVEQGIEELWNHLENRFGFDLRKI
jgi:hypothetical protein